MQLFTATNALAAITLLNIESVYGQRPPSILSCLDIGCPVDARGSTSQCKLVDKTYRTIGVATIPMTSSNLTGASWTEGVDVSGSRPTIYNTNFYFGSPPDKNLTGIGACAVFFNDVSSRLAFPGTLPEISEGTCDDAMTSQCTSALIKRATDMDFNGLGTSDACKKLQTAFSENLDSACASSAPGAKWTGVTVKGNSLELPDVSYS